MSIFDDSSIAEMHDRWQNKIGNQPSLRENLLSVSEVLRAHFLVANFFATEGNGLGGCGPRENGELLISALSRQSVEFGGRRKWDDDIDIAATVLFGLVKNHPFHDGNKRTALLSVLHLLEKQGRMAMVKKINFENLVVMVANGGCHRSNLYAPFRGKDDAEVLFISSRLRNMTRRIDRARHPVTYRQLNGLLRKFGYELRRPDNNRIDVVRIEDGQTIRRIGFHGWSRQVSHRDVKTAREACKLLEPDGVDSKSFYEGEECMDFLLHEYAVSLRKLADQ